MAWSWSHTVEAYLDAEANLRDLDLDTLRVIWAEWRAMPEPEDGEWSFYDPGFDQDAYTAALAEAASLDAETLADSIWCSASEMQTCDNGGWNAWMCPYGCGCHTVPFSRDADDEL